MSDITFNRYAILGTAAQRALFTPDPTDISVIGPGEFLLPFWLESDTGNFYAWNNVILAWQFVVASGGAGITQLTGEVTAGPGIGIQAAVIANAAVVNARLADMAQSTIKGRAAGAGTGVPVDLTITQVMAALGIIDAITFVIDGGGSAIVAGVKRDVIIPYAGTILSVTMLADVSGSIVVDLWKDTYANYPPTVADTITAAAKPTITTAIKSQDNTLTGWNVTVAAGDIIRPNVDSATTITAVVVTLGILRT